MFHVATSVAYLASRAFTYAHTAARYGYLGLRWVGTQNSSATMDVVTLNALDDNYMYLIIDKSTNKAAMVDPVNPSVIPEIIKKTNAELTTVLTTHHHWDHAGGNEEVKKMFPNIQIYGGDDRVQAITNIVKDGDVIKLGNLEISCFSTPCHTKGHICYYINAQNEKAVFTGDTLFLAGCGRFFEGTADQMNRNLNEILAKFPDETNVYCGHEYTQKNLQFGLTIEPNNKNISEKLDKISEVKKSGQTYKSVPGTIAEEKLTNVFMRVTVPEVMDRVGKTDPIDVMAALRKMKDAF